MADNWTIGKILNWTRQYFSEKGIENPRLDAEVLLCHVLEKNRLYLYTHFDRPLDPGELAAYRELIRARAKRTPVAYAVKSKEFMGLGFKVTEAVLIPRPDTEILVETALDLLLNVPEPVVADIGTGSGAIVISLLTKINQAFGVAVDISPEALAVAEENAARHQVLPRLKFAQGDLFAPLGQTSWDGRRFDAILSNPPYIPTTEIASLSEEVRQEPKIALDGGADGLDFYRRLLREAPDYLNENGFLAVEIGTGQADKVAGLAQNTEMNLQKKVKDYSGIDRVLVFTKA